MVNFLSSAPSLRKQMKQGETGMDYNNLVLATQKEPVQFRPRNRDQVQYYDGLQSVTNRLGKDSFITIHEIAFTVPGFVWSIRSYPGLVMCFGLPALADYLKYCKEICLSYDTTFLLGDFYLLVLVTQLSFQRQASYSNWVHPA